MDWIGMDWNGMARIHVVDFSVPFFAKLAFHSDEYAYVLIGFFVWLGRRMKGSEGFGSVVLGFVR